MLCLFQEMKINIDDMLRAGLEKHPENESLLEVQEWMNKFVNRTTSESSQKEDQSSQTLMITLGDETDERQRKEASIETDEPQTKEASIETDEPQPKEASIEPTFTQFCLDPAFMETIEKIEPQQPVIKIILYLIIIDELILHLCDELIFYLIDEPLTVNRFQGPTSQYSTRTYIIIRLWFYIKRSKTL